MTTTTEGSAPQPLVDVDSPRAPRRTSPFLAGVVFVALLAVLVGVIAVAGTDDEPTVDAGGVAPLALVPGSDAASEPAMYPARVYEFRLEGQLPDLGTTGAVYRLVAPPLDEARVAEWAQALGVSGEVRPVEGGYEVVQPGGGALWVYEAPGGWSLSYTPVGPDTPGAGGGSSSDPGASGGSADEPTGPDTPVSSEPVTTLPGVPAEPTPTIPEPVDLPLPADAEAIARDLLDGLGVLEGIEWEVEVADSGTVGIAVACAEGQPCPEPPPPVVTARSVQFRRIVDRISLESADWYVEVGDLGAVLSVSGTWYDLDAPVDAPLRPVADAYDDLASGAGYPWPVPLGAEEPAMREEGSIGDDADVDSQVDAEASRGGSGAVEPGSPGTGDTEPPSVIVEPEPLPEPEPVVVTITGAEPALMLLPAEIDGETGAYLVPAYRFVGRFEDGTEYSTTVLALDPQVVTAPSTGIEPMPLPAEPPAEPAPKPDPGGR